MPVLLLPIMKSKWVIVAFVAILLAVPIVTGGGIVFYGGPRYTYDRDFGNVEKGDGFIPKHFHLGHNVSETTLIPLYLYRVRSRFPKALKINRYDITYLATHKGFSRFRFDELSVVYDNGKKARLITRGMPESSRTFEISENWQKPIIFPNGVSERSGFRVRMVGVSFAEDGREYPFEYEMRYRYSSRARIGLGFERWAGV